MKTLILIFSLFIFGSYSNAQNVSTVKKLTATELQQKIQKNNALQIVDVRTPGEFKKGHIRNAMNIDINGSEFKNQLAALDKTKPVFVYCLSGGRSKSAVNYMQKNGFTEIFELPGGMIEWRSENLPEVATTIKSKGMSLKQYESLITSDKMVLVDFYAEWCAPCKKMKPYLEKLATDMKDKIVVVRIDADENAALCKELKVAALPDLKLYNKKKDLVWENKGFIEEAALKEKLIAECAKN